MRRFTFALLLPLLVLPGSAHAQSTFTLRGGINVATLGGDDAEDAESRTALNLGASYLVPLSGNVGLQIGGHYSQKGASLEDDGTEVTFKLDYAEFPVLLRLNLPSSGSVSGHLLGGPAIAFEVGCEAEGQQGGLSVTFDCDAIEVDTKSVDFGAVIGAGLSFEASERLSIVFDVLYGLGLTSIDDSGSDEDVKNRAFMIQAGVGFPIG